MADLLILLGALIGAAGLYPYIKSTINGSVRPQLVTWSIWTVLAGVLTISSLQQGQIASAALSAQAFVSCLIIVSLGWRGGLIRLTQLDILCLIGAVAGIGSLVVLRDPTTALFVAVAVDAIAFIPTFRHAWESPEEESLICFALSATSATLALTVAIMHQNQFDGLVYPLYAVLFNSATVIILLISRQVPELSYSTDSTDA